MEKLALGVVLSVVLACAGCGATGGPRVGVEPRGKLEVAAIPRAEVLHVAVEFVPELYRGSLLQRLAHELGALERDHQVIGTFDKGTGETLQTNLKKIEEDPASVFGPLMGHVLPDVPGVTTPDRPVPTMKRFPRVAAVHVAGAGLEADTWTDTMGRARVDLGPFALAALAAGNDEAVLSVTTEGQAVEVPFDLEQLSSIVAWTAADAKLPRHGLDDVDPSLIFWSRVLAASPSPALEAEARRRLGGVLPLDAASVALVTGERGASAMPDGAAVDWRAGPMRENPRVTYDLSVRREPIGDGDELLLAITNVGRAPVFQVRGLLSNGAVLLFGRVGAGETIVRRLLVPRGGAASVTAAIHATDDRSERAATPD